MNYRTWVISYKLLFGFLGISAVMTELLALVHRGVFNPSNFFSFFTIQTNILVVASFALSALLTLRNKSPNWLNTLRAATSVYILIVGLGFAALLSGREGLVLTAVPWDNVVLHYIIPMAVLLDFAIDRPRLRTSYVQNLSWLAFPALYCVYTFVRGAATGWYPYPFLDPAVSGTAEIAIAVAGIVVLGTVLVWIATRFSKKSADFHG